MKITVIASGSKGNATLIETDNTKILIDLGISCNNIENKLKSIDVKPKDINAILVTHAHSDHVKGIFTFIKKHKPKVYLSPIICDELELHNYQELNFYEPLTYIDDLTIRVFKVSHDAKETFGFLIKYLNKECVFIPDTGYINKRYINSLKNKDIYIIESNYDPEMLTSGPYPHHLKRRIWSTKGHLSNQDSAHYLKELIGNNTKHVVLAHLSEQNNHPEIAETTHRDILKTKLKNTKLCVAKQDEILECIEV